MELSQSDILKYLILRIKVTGLDISPRCFSPLEQINVEAMLEMPAHFALFTLELFAENINLAYRLRTRLTEKQDRILQEDIEEALRQTSKQILHSEKNVIPEDVKRIITANCPCKERRRRG